MAESSELGEQDRIRIIQAKPYLSFLLNQASDSSLYRIGAARNGDPLLYETGSGRERPLSSAYDPGREAERMLPVDLKRWKGREIIFLFGLGNPLVIPFLLSRLGPGQIFIILDPRESLGVFLARFSSQLREFLRRPGCHLFCGPEMLDSFFTYIDSIPAEKLTGVRTITHAGSRTLFPEFFSSLEDRISRTIQGRLSDLLTRFEFEKRWIANIIRNTIFFPPIEDRSAQGKSVEISRFAGRLESIPAVLVSAGPSLKESLPLLKLLSERAFLLVCDTAVKVVQGAGIPVHGAITLDAQPHSLHHFLGVDLSRTVLFSDIVATPSLLRHVKPAGLVFSTTARFATAAEGNLSREATAGTEYLEAIAGPVGHLQSGGSVATTAYDLLRFLKAKTIYLIGQDLAYTGRKIHSTGTHHNERWLPSLSRIRSLESINEAVIQKRDLRMVESLNGGEVLTDYVLDLYRHWFQESVPESEVSTVNLTARGARIPGVDRPEDLEKAVLALPVQSNLKDLFADAPPPGTWQHPQQSSLIQDLESVRKEALAPKIFFERYPSLYPLARRAAVYAARNREKLGEIEAEAIYEKRVHEDLISLHRKLERFQSQRRPSQGFA